MAGRYVLSVDVNGGESFSSRVEVLSKQDYIIL